MARQFVEKTITFQRTVTQEQEVVVKVPPELTGKLAEEYAEAVAWKRIDERKWLNPATIDAPKLVAVDRLPAKAS